MSSSVSQQLLNKQLEQLTALEQLLNDEKELLTQRDPEALNTLTEQKKVLLEAIEGLDANISKNPQFLADKAQNLLDDSLEEIQATLLRCQELNVINGQVITHSQLAVERMKTTLLERHNRSSMTYDNKGKKHAGLSSLDIKA
ncbi:flagella synthesis protein FlgN [Thalassotalea euphylliae]|uniref:Flagellar protein FlgN n=1 Tax=Thalassotalea euphylliae TaxID=1655234 RepID=A0A3E0U065_9GAMM|nr:flagellar protein FlgN [Thalassotalea euphylliae]REL30308.1 flagellar protein FlgN [Thalassotalea euphylliae]